MRMHVKTFQRRSIRDYMEYTHHYDSPLGGITLASDGQALIGLWFDEQKYFADTLGQEYQEKALPVFHQADRWLDLYFSGKAPDFMPPLHMKTTEFRKAVWEIMLTIPFGHTMTYGEIADRIAVLDKNGKTYSEEEIMEEFELSEENILNAPDDIGSEK